MNSDSEYARGAIGQRALVAAFGDRESAHEAAKTLHKEGFHKIWIGVTRADSGDLTSENESISAKIGRFISGEADGGTLIETLMRHGVSVTEAERVERQLEPNDVLVTVDGANHPELAAQILEGCTGDVLAGESFAFTTVDWTTDYNTGSELLGYQDPNEYARGKRVDDLEVTRLRNERLLTTAPALSEDIFISRIDNEGNVIDPRSRRR